MPFDFDPDDSSVPSFPQIDRIDTQESAAFKQRGASVRIDTDLCEATGVCAEMCPEDVLQHSRGTTRVINALACTECWICIENCVSGAIEIT